MFGDAGHGLIMFLAALWMVMNEKKFMGKKIDNEVFLTYSLAIDSRYIAVIYNKIIHTEKQLE